MRTQNRLAVQPAALVADENPPALVKAIVSLFDFLDATREIRTEHGPRCECGACTELRGMVYTVELFQGALQAQATRSTIIDQRELRCRPLD